MSHLVHKIVADWLKKKGFSEMTVRHSPSLALEKVGVEFLDDGLGVRLKPPKPRKKKGK